MAISGVSSSSQAEIAQLQTQQTAAAKQSSKSGDSTAAGTSGIQPGTVADDGSVYL